MTAAQVLGAILALWGAAGMYVAGKGQWKGWARGLAAQPVWVAFALVVHSWPLVLSPLLYGTVYGRNLWRWYREAKLKRCTEAGTHQPVIIDLGRSKMCMTCGLW